MEKNNKTEELKTLKEFIDRYIIQRNMIESAIINFYDARVNVDDFALSSMIDDLEYFNKKIIKAIKISNKLNDEERTKKELAKYGINLEN